MIPDTVKLIVADTETTDASPERGVCEVGWVEIDVDFNVLAEFESLIDPGRPICPSASGIHGLTNADVCSSPTLSEFFSVDDPSCYGRKIEGPVVVIGHRIGFDTELLKPHVDGEIFELCTLRWARRLYPDAPDHKLSTLMYLLNLPKPENAHRVMSDIYSALYLAKHIAERVGGNALKLARASQEPFEVLTVPFGKHKGQPFNEVPSSYLSWMLGNMKDLDQDMLHTINLHLSKGRKRT